MPKIIFVVPLIFMYLFCPAQNRKIDSLRKIYNGAKTDTDKANMLVQIGFEYAQSKPDSELLLARQALLLSRKAKYLKGELRSVKLLAEAYQFLGNYPQALQYYLERLKLDEQNPDVDREVVTMLSIANLYKYEGDHKKALNYAQKGYRLIDQQKPEDREDSRWYSYMTLGEIYDKMKDIGNALTYNKKAYALALKKNNPAWIGMTLNNVANVYATIGQTDTAISYYRRALPYLVANNVENFLSESYYGMAGIMAKNGKTDSAIYYAKRSLNLASSSKLIERSLRSTQLLTFIYRREHLPDSALHYQDMTLALKDSLFSQEKEREVTSLTIAEEIRQKDRAQEKIDEEKERQYKLKTLLVGLLIPTSFLISLILSKRKMHHRVVEFSGIISLLLAFEYLTILLHPIVVEWTHHSPFWEILIFVTLAAVLTPAHHRLEHWMLTKLTKHHPRAAKPGHAASHKDVEPARTDVPPTTTSTS